MAAGLPRELPVMTAVVESGLENKRFPNGQAGFFRMREAIWNHDPYTGYPDRPELQMKWFVDQALAVQRRHQTTDPDFGHRSSDWVTWAADVEQPVEHRRDDYRAGLKIARRLLAD